MQVFRVLSFVAVGLPDLHRPQGELGVGVERTFPVHSPILAKIEVQTFGDVRRAKLYYLRDRVGKAAKIKEKRA